MKETARIAVVGAGWWACEYHIPDVLKNENAELVSVAGLGEEALQQLKRHFKISHVTENHRDVYSENPDGVIVAYRACMGINMPIPLQLDIMGSTSA